jgi:hypothetical protein
MGSIRYVACTRANGEQESQWAITSRQLALWDEAMVLRFKCWCSVFQSCPKSVNMTWNDIISIPWETAPVPPSGMFRLHCLNELKLSFQNYDFSENCTKFDCQIRNLLCVGVCSGTQTQGFLHAKHMVCQWSILSIYLSIYFLIVLGFKLRVLCLLGRHFTTWATPPAHWAIL